MDVAARKTDKRLEEIEKRLHKIYEQAQDDLTKSWKNYMEAQNAYVKDLQEAYGRAKDFGTPEEVREIGKELGVAKAERTLQNQYYKDMVKETTRKLANVNQTALNYVNGQMFWVYSTNYNQAAKDAHKVGFRFDMVDEATVRRRVMDGDIQLPKKKINVPKDQRWNTKQLNSSVLQGIVNGESMQKIADRILPVVNNNAAAAIRNARTMVTGAQNQGRQDSYGMMDKMGIVLKKVWMATPDERTRESHLRLDGEEVEYDKEFSNGLMFPGDPNGAPEEVYNCRCTMVTDIIGFRKADGRIEYVGELDKDEFHEQQIEEERLRREEDAPNEPEVTKEPERELTYAEKIEEIQRLVNDDGVTTEHVMNAGKALQDELNPIYETNAKKVKEAEEEYTKAYAARKEYVKEYDKEFDRRFSDPSLFEDKDYLDKVRKMEEKLDDMYAEATAARNRVNEAKKEIRYDKTSQLLKEKLQAVREMGSDGLAVVEHLSNSKSEVRNNIEYAYSLYPRAWVEKSVSKDKILPRKVSRGYYDGYTIAISGFNKDTKNETAVHELGHRFEEVVPGIKEKEKEFYAKRTDGLPLEWLGPGYRKDEVTRKDDFVHAYMGKDYGGSGYELVSMGFEYAYTDPLELAKDPEMQQWILGLLALVP